MIGWLVKADMAAIAAQKRITYFSLQRWMPQNAVCGSKEYWVHELCLRAVSESAQVSLLSACLPLKMN